LASASSLLNFLLPERSGVFPLFLSPAAGVMMHLLRDQQPFYVPENFEIIYFKYTKFTIIFKQILIKA